MKINIGEVIKLDAEIHLTRMAYVYFCAKRTTIQ